MIEVIYNGGNTGTGVPAQPTEVILTGNGGNPFIEGGWMGFSDMDNGYGTSPANTADARALLPDRRCCPRRLTAQSPTNFCSTSLDSAAAPTNTTVQRPGRR